MPEPLQTPVPGAVITVRAPGSPEFELGLILSVAERELDVAVVTEEVDEVTDSESVLSSDVAGFVAAVFPDIHGWVLREQMDEILGVAATSESATVWTGAGMPGPPVLSQTDPRSFFREELIDRWEPYWEPVLSLRATQTFGELLARRRAAIGADVGELSASTGTDPEAVGALERDDPDAFVAVGPEGLATMLRKLAVIFGAEAQVRLRMALVGRAFTASQPSVAYRTSRRRTPANLLRRDADRYVTAVHRYMND